MKKQNGSRESEYRSNGTLKTSFQFYEFVLASLRPRAELCEQLQALSFEQRALQAIRRVYQNTTQLIRDRCKLISRFMNYNPPGSYCEVSTKLYRNLLPKDANCYSTSPQKTLACPEMFLKSLRPELNFFVTFGKFDTVVVAPVPHLYWASSLRMSVADEKAFGGFMSFPTSRVKYCWHRSGENDGNVTDDERVLARDLAEAEHPLVLWSFLGLSELTDCDFDFEKRRRKNRGPSPRARRLLRVVDWLHGTAEDQEDGTLHGSADRRVAQRLEVFLSFSTHFPVIVKAEFDSVQEMDQYMRMLRDSRRIASSATILSVRGAAIWPEILDDENERQFFQHNRVETMKLRLPFGILVKVVPGTDQEVRRNLLRDLSALQEKQNTFLQNMANPRSVSKIYPDVFERASYWDLFAFPIELPLPDLVDYVANGLRDGRVGLFDQKYEAVIQNPSSGFVERTATIPFWTTAPSGESGPRNTESASRPSTPIRNHGDLLFGEGLLTRDFHRDFVLSFPEKMRDGDPDILSLRIYYLKFELEWLSRHFRQLAKTWSDSVPGQGGATFRFCDDLTVTFMRYSQRIIAGVDALHRMDILEKRHCSSRLWAAIGKLEARINQLKENVQCIRLEYHQLTEGVQALTITEPRFFLGERSGVADMFHRAAAVLMRSYSGYWDFSGRKDFSDSKAWDGIVVASENPSDWQIQTDIQILHIPLEFRLDVHRRLTPFGHEICHQLLRNVIRFGADSLDRKPIGNLGDGPCGGDGNGEIGAYSELTAIWRVACSNAADGFRKVRAILERGVRELEGKEELEQGSKAHDWLRRLLTDAESLETRFRRRFLDEKMYQSRIENSEILVDLLWFLCAGPSSVSTLYELIYRAGEPLNANHPPVWERIFMGERVFLALGLEPRLNPWLYPGDWADSCSGGCDAPLRRESLWQAVLEQEGMLDPNLEYLCKFMVDAEWECDGQAAASIVDGFRPARQVENVAASSPWTSWHTFLIRSFLQHDCELVRQLSRWCADYSYDFLFIEVDSEGRFASGNATMVVERCAEVAARLVFNEEIVMDADPREIAAASMHPLIRRPVHPAGRIIHSLFYSAC